ncbi:unnamed protein product [Coregonus sp. 'balchen']|nr:unnamed protein product [Coregonus sp. 'balchen']
MLKCSMSQLTPVSNLEQGGCHRLREGEGWSGRVSFLMEKLLLLQYSTIHDLGQRQWRDRVRGLPDAQLACGDNPPRERQSQGGMQEDEVGDNGSLAHNTQDTGSDRTKRERDRRTEEPRGLGPFFFFGGGNGASILREYDRVSSKVNHGRGLRRLKLTSFSRTPSAWDMRDEREAFFAQQEGARHLPPESQEDISAFRLKLQNIAESQCNRTLPFRLPQARIVQQWGRKFDVRSYFLIACTSPYMAFFRHGYVRLTCDLYDPNSPNLSSHLTNQKKNPLYSVLKEETVWSMDRFNTYVNDKLNRKLGYFDLIGCDFMIDDDFKVWLLEMNCNPALHTNCEVLKEFDSQYCCGDFGSDSGDLHKCRCGLKLLPLASQRDFVLLYDGETAPVPVLSRRSKTAVRLRAQRPKSAPPKCPSTTSRTQKAESVASVSREKSVSENTFSPVSMMAVLEPLMALMPPKPPAPTILPSGSQPTHRPSRVPQPHPTHNPVLAPKPAQAAWSSGSASALGRGDRGTQNIASPQISCGFKSTFMSLSTPAMTEGSRLSVRCLRASKACHPDQEQPFCYSLRPTQFRLAQPGTSGPVWTDKQDKEGGQEGEGGQDPSAAKEEKEDKEHREQL